MKRLLLASPLIVAAGCVAPPLCDNVPTYPLLDDRATISAVAASLHQVHNVSAQGAIDLAEPGGDRVRLDAVMVMRPPNEARVRAWKFGEAVFDLTIRPDGAWLLSDRDHAEKMQVSASQLAQSLSMLSGAFLDSPDLILHDDGGELIARRARPDEPTITCTIDRATRTIRRYTIMDRENHIRLSMDQLGFEMRDGIAWPDRIELQSDAGRIAIQLNDVTINGGVPDTALLPPHRAIRLP